jgi:hypothetical protein
MSRTCNIAMAHPVGVCVRGTGCATTYHAKPVIGGSNDGEDRRKTDAIDSVLRRTGDKVKYSWYRVPFAVVHICLLSLQ